MVFTLFKKLFSPSKTQTPKERINSVSKEAFLDATVQQAHTERVVDCSLENQPHTDFGQGRTYQQSSINRKFSVKRSQSDISADHSNLTQSYSLEKYLEDLITCQKVERWVDEWEQARFRKSVAESAEWFFTQEEVDSLLNRTECGLRPLSDKKTAPGITLKASAPASTYSQKRHVELVHEVLDNAYLKGKTNSDRELQTTSTELSAGSVSHEECADEKDPADGSQSIKPYSKVSTNRVREGQSQFQRKATISGHTANGYTANSLTIDGTIASDKYSSRTYAFHEGDNLRSTCKLPGTKPAASSHFGGNVVETRNKKVRSNQRLSGGQSSNVVKSMSKAVASGQIKTKNLRADYSGGSLGNVGRNICISVLMPSGECEASVAGSKSGAKQQLRMHPMTNKGPCAYKSTPMNQYDELKEVVHSTSPNKSGTLERAHVLSGPIVISSVEGYLNKRLVPESGGNQAPRVDDSCRSTKSQILQTKISQLTTARDISETRRSSQQYSCAKGTGAEDKRLVGKNPNLSAPHITQLLRMKTRNTQRYTQSQGLNPRYSRAKVLAGLRKSGKGSLSQKARRSSAADLRTKGCNVKDIRKVIPTSELDPQNLLSGVNESQTTQETKAETNRIPMSISTYAGISLRRLMPWELEKPMKCVLFQANNHNVYPHPVDVGNDERPKHRKLTMKVYKKESQLPSQLCRRIRKPLCYSSQAHNDVASRQEECNVPPLMKLEELKSYTLSGSTQSVPCNDRVRSADETSDTFILSAASEFLHSSSDEQFAFKHRPRPGVAPGRGITVENGSKKVSSSQIVLKKEPTGTDSLQQHDTLSDENTWRCCDQKSDDGCNTLKGMTVKMSKQKESTVSDQSASKTSRSCTKKRYNRKYGTSKRKHLMGGRMQSGLRRNQRHPSRASQCGPEYIWRAPFSGYKKARIQITRGTRVPWNFSPRNPALRYYDIRPIESALWPDGRVPGADHYVPRKLSKQRCKTPRTKYTSKPRRHRIRGKRNLLEAWMGRQRLSSNEQETKSKWPNGSACMHSGKQGLDRNLTETPCSTIGGMGIRRNVEQNLHQSLWSSKKESKTEKHEFRDTGNFPQSGGRVRVPSVKCPHSTDKVRANAVRERRRKKSPPLWSAATPRKTSSAVGHGRRGSQSLSNSCKPKEGNNKLSKEERRAQVNTTSGALSPTTLVDFVAYVSVIPSEVDEMVLPFRACNRLRSYLKDIDKLLLTLESGVTDDGEIPFQDNGFAPKFVATGKNKLGKPGPRDYVKKEFNVTSLLNRLRNRYASTKRERRRMHIEKSLHRHMADIIEGDGANSESNSSIQRMKHPGTMSREEDLKNALHKRRFWQQLLRDIHDPILSQLLQRMSEVTDRRIYAIEKQNECRIHLDEKTIYCVRGLPCMKLTISSSKMYNVQRALVQLQVQFPNIFKQIIYTERFCGRGIGCRIPTDCKLSFGAHKETPQRHTSSTLCHVITAIEKAKKQKAKQRIPHSALTCE